MLAAGVLTGGIAMAEPSDSAGNRPAPMSSELRLTPLSGQATRVGYPRDFRNPTVDDLAALALPGLGGLILVTFGGSVLGYRQANSLRFVRPQGAQRFLR